MVFNRKEKEETKPPKLVHAQDVLVLPEEEVLWSLINNEGLIKKVRLSLLYY